MRNVSALPPGCSFALGPLQSLVTLERIYLFSALLAVPLFVLGWRLSAGKSQLKS
jgi:hypothetical protein